MADSNHLCYVVIGEVHLGVHEKVQKRRIVVWIGYEGSVIRKGGHAFLIHTPSLQCILRLLLSSFIRWQLLPTLVIKA